MSDASKSRDDEPKGAEIDVARMRKERDDLREALTHLFNASASFYRDVPRINRPLENAFEAARPYLAKGRDGNAARLG